MATCTIYARKGKHTSIYIIYRHHNKSKLYSTGIRVDPEHWRNGKVNLAYGIKNIKANRDLIKKLNSQSDAYNATIQSKKADIEDIAKRLMLEKNDPTIEKIDADLQGPEIKTGSIAELKEKYLKYCDVNKQPSTRRSIRYGLKVFDDFAKDKDLTLDSFNQELFDDYKEYLLYKKDIAYNTAGDKIKILKAFLYYLFRRGYKVNSEFLNYKPFKEETEVIFLTEPEYIKLRDHNFEKDHLRRTRDIFILQCNLGLRISDLFRLDRHHFENDMINTMKVYKTKKKILLPLSSDAKKILDKFNYRVPDMEFPVYNRQIKDIARIAELNRIIEKITNKKGKKTIEQNPLHKVISSHAAVKTFITLCVQKGISPRTVSRYTGKSVEVLVNNYYGDDQEYMETEMKKFTF